MALPTVSAKTFTMNIGSKKINYEPWKVSTEKHFLMVNDNEDDPPNTYKLYEILLKDFIDYDGVLEPAEIIKAIIELRITSVNDTIPISTSCTECGTLNDDPETPIEDILEFKESTLGTCETSTGYSITFSDYKTWELFKKVEEIDNIFDKEIAYIAAHIDSVTVDGNTGTPDSFEESLEWVNSLDAKTYEEISRYVASNRSICVLTIPSVCLKCGNNETRKYNIDVLDFLWG